MCDNFTLAEYVWLDAKQEARSKTKVIPGKKGVTLEELSHWNYDGSSCGQAPGIDSEVSIHPCAIYPDPFRGAHHVIVLCDTYTPKGEPLPTNTRFNAAKIFAQKQELVPWYGIEQEYVMFKDGTPLGWPKCTSRGTVANPAFQIGYPGPQGPYYCSNGADVAFGREIVEEHMLKCLYMGINVSGTNAEVMPGQWEYQVGPSVGISAADDHTISRFIMARVCEKYGVVISYDPKPVPGDWNGSGCHTNFSTVPMREAGGYEAVILPAVEKLGARHKEHIAKYGEGNSARLTGHHETASMEKFSWGVANRGASIRVGSETAEKGYGYLEDRRPAANMDPYIVCSMIFETTSL
ncbi:hypothetical protein BASA81_012818 [Batrachochytrium salamandrivorans]|nr:hypothetical protein BASA81_012818 [Batrachochytrium salamandrivorans]